MPTATESVVLGAWAMLFWGGLLVCAVSVTAFAVRRHTAAVPVAAGPDVTDPGLTGMGKASSSATRSDILFWDLFMGSAVALPALLIPSVMSPWAGAVLAALGGATGAAAYRFSPRVVARQELRRQRRLDLPLRQAAEAEHEKLLARWRRYELDPAFSIEYPAITDVRMPETSALIKAMRQAEELRTMPRPGAALRTGATVHDGYAPAVERLVVALAAAERAAGIPGTGR
ncbi:MAG TPA: hypothetical protein VIM08_08410 [Arthrobacter sp.]